MMKLKTIKINKVLFVNLELIFLILAFSFSPSFVFGSIEGGREIEIRIEDILLLIFGLFWILNTLCLKKIKFKKPPLLKPILLWLSIGFFSVLMNLILSNITLLRGFFYYLKEVEFFFIYFFVFYHVKNLVSVKYIINFLLIISVVGISLIIYQLANIESLRYGTYGPAMFMEKGPFPSGGFFLILFIIFLNLFIYYYINLNLTRIKKFIISISILSLAIGVISSGSRTAILGLIFSIIVSFSLAIKKQKRMKLIFIFILILIVIIGMIDYISEIVTYVKGILLVRLIKSYRTRSEIWKYQLKDSKLNLFSIFFGFGKSVRRWESHSQFLRNFLEAGIMGSLAFLFLMYSILKIGFKHFYLSKEPLLVGLSSGVIVCTLTMLFVSIPNDAFVVVKPNQIFWVFLAITMAALSLKSSSQSLYNKFQRQDQRIHNYN